MKYFSMFFVYGLGMLVYDDLWGRVDELLILKGNGEVSMEDGREGYGGRRERFAPWDEFNSKIISQLFVIKL
jgi:hypothetical protein